MTTTMKNVEVGQWFVKTGFDGRASGVVGPVDDVFDGSLKIVHAQGSYHHRGDVAFAGNGKEARDVFSRIRSSERQRDLAITQAREQHKARVAKIVGDGQ